MSSPLSVDEFMQTIDPHEEVINFLIWKTLEHDMIVELRAKNPEGFLVWTKDVQISKVVSDGLRGVLEDGQTYTLGAIPFALLVVIMGRSEVFRKFITGIVINGNLNEETATINIEE